MEKVIQYDLKSDNTHKAIIEETDHLVCTVSQVHFYVQNFELQKIQH